MAATAGVSDASLKAKTGKTWAQWIKALDAEGCASMNHRQIVALVRQKFSIEPWWQQSVTVGYEQAKGLRHEYQTPEGFQASVSRKLNVPAEEVFEQFNDARKRSKWLPDSGLRRRGATKPKSVRFDASDGSSVLVWLTGQEGGSTQVSLSHTKLKDASEVTARKAYWGDAMKRLKAALGA